MGDLYNGSESESESLRSFGERVRMRNRDGENAENRWKELQRNTQRERVCVCGGFRSMHQKDESLSKNVLHIIYIVSNLKKKKKRIIQEKHLL